MSLSLTPQIHIFAWWTLGGQFYLLSSSECFLLFFSFTSTILVRANTFLPDSPSTLTTLLFLSEVYSPPAARWSFKNQIWCVMPWQVISALSFLQDQLPNCFIQPQTLNDLAASCLLLSPSVCILHGHPAARWASFQCLMSFTEHLPHSCYSFA